MKYVKPLDVRCPHCGADVGRWCRTFTGAMTDRFHVKRRRASGMPS